MNCAFLCLGAALLAGLASTLLELSWLRSAATALPGTVPAGAVVVPTFLVAWMAGSAVAGRWGDAGGGRLDRAARWLAASAAATLAVPWVLALVQPDGVPTGWLARLVVGGLPVVPAAFGLGGALPLLARARAAEAVPAARATGAVAACVALGGALGASVWLDAARDEGASAWAAVALTAAAALCWLLAPWQRSEPVPAPSASEPPRDEVPARGAFVLVVAATLGGALLVAGQLVVLRLMAQFHGDSIATTSDVLAAVHLGMAVGAAALCLPLRALGARGATAWSLGLAGLGLAVPARMLGAVEASAALDPRLLALAWAGLLGVGAGSVVTAASRLPRRAGRLGSWVGDLAAWSTLGGAVGGPLYAQVLAPDPEWGTGAALRAMMLAACAAAVVLAVLRLAQRRHQFAAGVSTVALAGVAVFGWNTPAPSLPWRAAPEESELLYRSEGPYGVLTLVVTEHRELRLKLDNRFGLGGASASLTESRLGRIAAALHPTAERALLLGLGGGQTLAGLATASHARVDCVERNAQILELEMELPFAPTMPPRGGPPNLVHADARAWVADHPGHYDLIVGDLFFPWTTGAGDLLSAEHFDALRGALRPAGVVVQWVPLHQLPWAGFGAVVNAFLESFPTARLFVATPLASQPLVALVGGLDEGLPAAALVDGLLSARPVPYGPNGMVDLYDLYVADAWALTTRFDGEPVNRQSRPVSELVSQRRHDDEEFLARTNTRLLADLATPLETTSLMRAPVDPKERRLLGRELSTRNFALTALLAARADALTLASPETESWDENRRRGVEARLGGALVEAWRAFPGHNDVRRALSERAATLSAERRWEDAALLLDAAVAIHPDADLSGRLGALLARLGRSDEAVELLERAREAAPGDVSGLLNLASALLHSARDADAREVLEEAARLFEPGPLPQPHATALLLLDGEEQARETAQRLLPALEPGDPWAATLRRLRDS